MTRPPWIDDLEADESDERIDSIVGIFLAVVISLFCAFSLGLIYQLASHWIADVLTFIWKYLR